MALVASTIAGICLLMSLPVFIELGLFLVANLLLGAKRRRLHEGAGEGGRPLRLAILVPAHDEEKDIARCVGSLLASDRGGHDREVIVIADNCGDGTAAAARSAGARVLERFDQSLKGKGAALDHALRLLMREGHDAFIVVDADAVVAVNFVRTMGDLFASGAEALQCVYLPLNVEASRKVGLMRLAMLSMNVFRPMGRELLGCSCGLFGNGFGLSRDLLLEVPYTANSITEDLEYHLRLVEKGRKVHFTDRTSVLSDFPLSREGSRTQRARWEGGRLMLQRTMFLPLLGKLLSGRFSLLEPLLELMSLPVGYASLLFLSIALIPWQPLAGYGIAGLALLGAQVVASILLYGERRDFGNLLFVPAYLVWKMANLPAVLLGSRRKTEWKRTRRD